MNKDLQEKRMQIDLIDEQIMKLLDERFQIVKEIKKIKKSNSISVTDSTRELKILEKTNSYKNKEYINKTYKHIFEESKALQNEE